MQIVDIIKKKPYLAWDVRDFDALSESSILERILNFGDWDDVQDFIKLKGRENTKNLYFANSKTSRTNYLPKIKAYFDRYFQK